MMNKTTQLEILTEQFSLYSEELGIDLSEASGRFKWFLASILFGARIGEQIAMNTYRCFEDAGIDTPEQITGAGWDRLVEILDSGGYVRYDFSTAQKLLDIAGALKEKYGSLEDLYNKASSTKDVEKRLMTFKGIGPTTAQIFLRELRGKWKVAPSISALAQRAAQSLDIDLDQLEDEELAKAETALVKLELRYCKKSKCNQCPVKDFCLNPKLGKGRKNAV
jgi:endonuclease III